MKFGALLLQDPIFVIEVIAAALTFLFIVKLSLEPRAREEASVIRPQTRQQMARCAAVAKRNSAARRRLLTQSSRALSSPARSWTPPAFRLHSENEVDFAQPLDRSNTHYCMVGSTISFRPQALCGQASANACH